ncbi:hypothetical protein FACS1894111_11510 [Clostridia bacterium]|nr:hypothetical protein FACS1894111_11510 [Clostridia bacterium]
MNIRGLKKGLALCCTGVLLLSLAGCGAVKENTVLSTDDMERATIGVQLGTTGDIFATDFKGNHPGTKVEEYNKGADAVQSLKQGKIDCVVIDEQPAKAFVEKNSDLKILTEEFAEEEYAICIAKNNAELKAKINEALDELKGDGTLDSIFANYIGDDTKGKSPYTSPADATRENGILKMATNAQFPPYEYYADAGSGAITGIDVDIVQAVCDKLGMELQVEDMEFDSIITAVQSGKADIGAAGLTVTEDRLENIDFTTTYATSRQVIIVRNK